MDQRTPSNYHVPVMASQVTTLFDAVEPGWVVDATFGGGGHTKLLLERRHDIRVLAIDRDPAAAEQMAPDQRLRFEAGNFADLGALLDRVALDDDQLAHPVGFLFDLGVSSRQLDEASRGFSYHHAGPLDMRMGPDAELTADVIVNEWNSEDIASAIRRYGEEQFASRIARAIVAARPITDTEHLAAVVAESVPAPARRRRHPARKTFQAIRIAVNNELAAVEAGIDAALDRVAVRGRVIVIAYHSLEDRIVKQRFVQATTGCVCPPELPECRCNRVAEFKLIARKAQRPDAEEVTRNPRSRSALLRAVERVTA